MSTPQPFGHQLREWRQRRHLSQLELAGEVDISTRHLSFVETGRSLPSRAMVLRLAERLAVPLRERNQLLVAAGYAPMYSARPLSDPQMAAARAAVECVLKGHEPYPALVVDRNWSLITANRSVGPFLAGVDPSLLAAPANVLRMTLHPAGLSSRIENLAQWRSHVFARLEREIELTADKSLVSLLEELRGYPGGELDVEGVASAERGYAGVVVPLKLRTEGGVLSMFSTTTVFGTAVEVTLSELVLEAFYPADEVTTQALRSMPLPA